jgi:hypothetical protein
MALEWNSRDVECRQCGKVLKASSFGCHLADVHDIYQQTVVAEELLEVRSPVLYTVNGSPTPAPYLAHIQDARDTCGMVG